MADTNTNTSTDLVKRRYPFVAFLLFFGGPGVGQLYNGEVKKALFFFCIYVVGSILAFTPVFSNFYLTLVLVLLSIAIALFALTDAIRGAIRIKQVHMRFYQRWYSLLVLVLLWWFVVPGPHELRPVLPYEAFRIPTGSMEPTIEYGDFLVADKRYYSHHSINPGDLAIFYYPTDSSYKYISRCLAVGGDTVEIRDRVPYVNGKPIASPGYSLGALQPITPRSTTLYSIFPPGAGNSDNYGPVIVPSGKCFMLSDNISNALDSRFKGFVDPQRIIARPLYIYWSSHLSRIGRELK